MVAAAALRTGHIRLRDVHGDYSANQNLSAQERGRALVGAALSNGKPSDMTNAHSPDDGQARLGEDPVGLLGEGSGERTVGRGILK